MTTAGAKGGLTLTLPKLPSAGRRTAAGGNDVTAKSDQGELADQATIRAARDDDDEGDNEVQAVESMLNQILSKRKQASLAADRGVAAKQAAVLQEAHDKVQAASEALSAAVGKDAKDAGAQTKSAFTKDMHALWKQYNEQYDMLAQAKADVKAAAEKRRAAAKRKLAMLQGEADKTVAEAGERLAKMKAKSSKLPGVLNMLQSLIDQ
ncbi:hypothetical protein QJQ45_008268 [Haematococcus lacustris]|nr:hypothetical protein QJQ45_008268 [Haematococcus lacustris]